MQSVSIGIRDAKINLSRLLKMVKNGNEVILTDRNHPVGKIVPIEPATLSLQERIKRLENQGIISMAPQKTELKVPLPIPVPDDLAQKLLKEDRDDIRW